MALPGDYPKRGGDMLRYGITVLLVPPTTTENFALYDVEVQRAPDSAGAPNVGAAVTIARLAPLKRKGSSCTDLLPNDGVRRHYRWRFVRSGYTAGSYSPWLSTNPDGTGTQGAKPVRLEVAVDVQDFALNRDVLFTDGKYALKASDTVGKETDDDLWIASTKTAKVGTVASPSSLSKTLRLPFTAFQPPSDTVDYIYQNNIEYLSPRLVNNREYVAAFVLPQGVTITVFRTRCYRNDSADGSPVGLLAKHASDGTATTIASTSHATTGAWSTETAALSQLVGTGDSFSVRINLDPNATATDTRLNWVEVDYTMPSYDKGI